ncbi:hypothetical protein COU50_00930 [bacterium CG10_big_fil_rev_8_21_14_0_10_33_18]|nr:MAG: hypothetical protein COU50_00930 [bacterium CG10_big_fil_rev_8_21_14_0_10_33_18]PIY85196.1 MAG: hypothetical protein COY76_03405 [bacterium CG_4_10_14_0_8_um_filter_33_57]
MFNNLQFIVILLTLVGSFWIISGHIFGSGEEIKARCSGDIEDISTDLYVYLDKQRIEAIVLCFLVFCCRALIYLRHPLSISTG